MEKFLTSRPPDYWEPTNGKLLDPWDHWKPLGPEPMETRRSPETSYRKQTLGYEDLAELMDMIIYI